jgi:hypothetical protein
MTLTTKRIIAGIYSAVLLVAAGNNYLHWNLTPGLEKKILAVATFIGVLCAARFGPDLVRELEEHRAEQKRQQSGEH